MADEHEITHANGGRRSFTWFLQRIDGGGLVHELTNKMADIGAALNQAYQDFRGKPKAKIVVTITIENDKGIMNVAAKYKIEMPGAPAATAVMWTDQANNFIDEDPRQPALFPRGPRVVS